MIEDAERERLQDHRFGEGRLHGEHRGAGEVELTFGVSRDRPPEAEALEEAQGLRTHDAFVAEIAQFVVAEAEATHCFEEASGAGDDPEPARAGEPACKEFEDARAVGRAVAQGGVEHREFVAIGEEGGARGELGAALMPSLYRRRPTVRDGRAGRLGDRE